MHWRHFIRASQRYRRLAISYGDDDDDMRRSIYRASSVLSLD